MKLLACLMALIISGQVFASENVVFDMEVRAWLAPKVKVKINGEICPMWKRENLYDNPARQEFSFICSKELAPGTHEYSIEVNSRALMTKVNGWVFGSSFTSAENLMDYNNYDLFEEKYFAKNKKVKTRLSKGEVYTTSGTFTVK